MWGTCRLCKRFSTKAPCFHVFSHREDERLDACACGPFTDKRLLIDMRKGWPPKPLGYMHAVHSPKLEMTLQLDRSGQHLEQERRC